MSDPSEARQRAEEASRKLRETLQSQRMQETLRLRASIQDTLSRIRRKLIVMSGKGGVGKSTVAVNLAAALSLRGRRVGLLDLDLTNPNVPLMLSLEEKKPEGSAERILPVRWGKNLWVMSTEFFIRGRDTPIIWRGPIKMNMIQQLLGNVDWGELDDLVVDLPPGTGDEPLTIAQILKDADGVLLVTTPQKVSVLDVQKSVQFARTMGLPILGVVENMASFSCPHCGKVTEIFSHGGGEVLSREYSIPLLARIPLDPSVVRSGEEGVPLVWKYPESPASKEFLRLVEVLPEGKVGERS